MTTAEGAGAYSLEGTLLGACSCVSPCPRWIAPDPGEPAGPLRGPLGPCDAVHAYHFDRGTIRGVVASGLMVVQGLAARGARFGTCLGKQERAVGKRSPLNRSGIRNRKPPPQRPKNFPTAPSERLSQEGRGSYIRLPK